MGEYFITVFWNNKLHQYRMTEILMHSFNGIVGEEYALDGIRYYFPIIVENGQYCIEDKSAEWKFQVNGNPINNERVTIKHGDYIKITGTKIELTMLITHSFFCSVDSNVYELKKGTVVMLGRAEEMNVVIEGIGAVSRKHASIRVDENEHVFVDDLAQKTGVYVNGCRANNYQLRDGDDVYIMGTTIKYYSGRLIIPANIRTNGLKIADGFETIVPSEKEAKRQYVRTPRIYKSLETCEVEIEPPTSPQKQKEVPFILAVGPSLTMSLAMLASLGVTISNALNGGNLSSIVTSGVMAVSMLLGALLWPSLSRSYSKRQEIANEEYRKNRYLAYLEKKDKELNFLYERNTRIWNENLFPTVKNLVAMCENAERRLWERGIGDSDFLTVRVGTGTKPFEVGINIKKKGFELHEDPLKEEGYRIAEKYSELKQIPITLSLYDYRVSGVVGAYQNIAKTMIANMVSLYAPEDVKLVLVYNRHQEKELKIFNDLPHMWSSDMKNRFVATNEAEAYTLFGYLDEVIQEREGVLGKDEPRVPYYVVLVFDQQIVANIPFKKTLLDAENLFGISSVFFGERFNQIPKECRAIIQKNEEFCGLYIKNVNDNKVTRFDEEIVSSEDITRLVNGISSISVKKEKTSSAVPESVSFLDVFRVGNVNDLNIESHWNTNNSNKSLTAPIGIMAGGEKFNLDIHEKYHGCHGLVAGTTGSGKSEFLQAYILSMMINYSPNEVSFVLVDFKGGDMARPFLKSPHLSATISNLSGNTLYRALVSLEAEVKNRQRIFNESASLLGVDKLDINSYHKYYKEHKLHNPLPHLIIVIDEFAQLKTQHPEFMAKLIDVAQVGRSLGIHLILATQKPSGVVDPQIWSNSRFKVCLKVMDKQDSSDMINRPVAAMIKTPGRAYVQVGYDEIFELIQSGYSGAEYVPQDSFVEDESVTVSMVNWPGEPIRIAKAIDRGEKTNLTQLEAIMQEVAQLGHRKGLMTKKLWLEPLAERLRLKDVQGGNEYYDEETLDRDDFGRIVCGIIDLPHIQEQIPYSIDFTKQGHLAVYGSSGTGKSTFIQTIFFAMAMKYSPKMFNSFVIDFNGGSLIGLSKMPHCVAYVTDEDEKKVADVLQTINQIIGDRRKVFAEHGCANYDSYIESGKQDMPIILGVIDNYASFREKVYKCEDILVQLIAAARACGIYFIITGSSKGAIYYKVTDHISNRVVFNMTDTGSYRDILNAQVPVFPESIKGRALILHDKQVAEMQVAVPFDENSESTRNLMLKDCYQRMSAELASTVQYSIVDSRDYELIEDEPYEEVYKRQPMKKMHELEDGMLVGTDIESGMNIGYEISDKMPIFIAEPNANKVPIKHLLEEWKQTYHTVNIYSTSKREEINDSYYIDSLDAFIANYVELAVDEKPLLVIDGFSDFFDEISDEGLEIFTKAIRDKKVGQIITFDDMSRISMYCDTELYLQLVKCSRGMIVGGSANNDLAVLLSSDFYSIPEDYRQIQLPPDQALVYENDSASYVQMGGC